MSTQVPPNTYYANTVPSQAREDPEVKQSFVRQLLHTARPDYVLKHLNLASFKIVFRTWAQIWLTVILLVVPATSHWLGPGAYLLQVVGFICVSGGNAIVYSVFSNVMCALSTCIAWLFEVIAAQISHRLRGKPSRESIIELLINDGSCTAENIEDCLLQQVFTGRFLRTNCSVIFCMALITGVMFLGLSQKLHPTFRLPFIMGIITLCINICYNVYFPFFDAYIISWDIIKVMFFSYAFNILCAIVIFPDTASHKYFAGYIGLLKKLKAASENNVRFFQSMKPSSEGFAAYKNYTKDITGVRAGIVPLEISASLSKYEISYGRLGPGAAGEARSCLKNLLRSASAFDFFYFFVDSRSKFASNYYRDRRASYSTANQNHHHLKIFGTIDEAYKPVGDYEHLQRKELIRKRLQQESSFLTIQDLDYICDILKPLYTPYLESNNRALASIIQWFEAANEYRTWSIFNREKHQQKQREQAQLILECRDNLVETSKVLEDPKVLEKCFRDKTEDEDTLLSMISQCSLMTFFAVEQSRSLVKLMNILIAIDQEVPKPKFYTYFTKSIFEKSSNILSSLQFEEPVSEIPIFQKYTNVSFRDPDSGPPSNFLHLVGVKIDALYKFFLNEELWFWFRSGCLVTICAVPYMCRTTSHWYFSNRLIWIVIMCGVSTSEYTGETIYVFGAKLVYSFFGCLIGMVAWYISTGSGSGNYYGFAAVCAVLYLYMAYYRHFSQHTTLVPAILYGVSSCLVLGTSWVDAKYNKIANVSYGFRVAYTRFLSVIIGLCVGFLASIIPRPRSSKVAVRSILSRVLGELGNLYCDVASFAFQRLDNASVHIVPRHDPIMERFRLILVKLAGLTKLSTPIKHEIPLKGSWPAAKYAALQSSVTKLVELYQQLHIIFDRIHDPEQWISHILERAGWYDVDLNADLFSIVHMCSGSLQSKTALPKITQATLSLKHFDVLKRQWGINQTTLNERFYREPTVNDEKKAADEKAVALEAGELHESMVNNLDYEKLLSHDGNLNIVALVLCHIIYQQFDEVALIVKSLVGEKYDLNDRLFRGDIGDDYKTE